MIRRLASLLNALLGVGSKGVVVGLLSAKGAVVSVVGGIEGMKFPLVDSGRIYTLCHSPTRRTTNQPMHNQTPLAI